MKISNQSFKLISMVLLLLVFSFPLFAQEAAPTLPGDPENVPIDGGISLLVAAGVGYGAKKMKERKAKMANADKG